MHGAHALSTFTVHVVLYWPIGHAEALHGAQMVPERKYPVVQIQSQASVPYGLPGEVYCAFGGAFVHGTHCPFAAAVQA